MWNIKVNLSEKFDLHILVFKVSFLNYKDFIVHVVHIDKTQFLAKWFNFMYLLCYILLKHVTDALLSNRFNQNL